MQTTRKFTPEEVALIHRTMMDGAGVDDVAMFVQTCERTGLDPFARQIMPSSRNTQKNGQWVTQWTWLVTIDGLRKIAIDSGDYEGQEGPFWCGPDGAWREIWTDSKNPPFAAKVLVHRRGFRTGLSGIAKYDSYVQKRKDGQPNQVWTNLGDHMTAKCAEALALRKAFPNEMAGLYTSDEMAQAGYEAPAPASSVKPPTTEPVAVNGWTIEAQDEFSRLMDGLYECLRGMPEEYEKRSEIWRGRMRTDHADKVLPAFQEFIRKLQAAASKPAAVDPAA